jgi:hypothetical protein
MAAATLAQAGVKQGPMSTGRQHQLTFCVLKQYMPFSNGRRHFPAAWLGKSVE